MSSQTLFFLLILLACPLMMVFMMRGGGHGSHSTQGKREMHDAQSGDTGPDNADRIMSIEELRSQREALDAEIATREAAKETRPKLPAGA